MVDVLVGLLSFHFRISRKMRESNIISGKRGRGNNWALGMC